MLARMMKIVPSAYSIIAKTLNLEKEDAKVRAWAFAAAILINGCAPNFSDPNTVIQSCSYSTFEHIRNNRNEFVDSDKSDEELYGYFYDFSDMLMDRWDELLKHTGVGVGSDLDHAKSFQIQNELCYLVEDGEDYIQDESRDIDFMKKSNELITLSFEAKTYFGKLT